ncbi:uncharacterized protein LOC130910653 [Corythoichthys intestinalis]|uniref:uncharacterized protein LOC130910653 n=1 Tax=Corythoichthys intestinalis TaxID=161448 RepID=UPI0025A6519A|nr:uncharacterized protein LOC130910653 [Corythoichthys intestinalis]
MASPLPSSSRLFCSVCCMYSEHPGSFVEDSSSCRKCSLVSGLETRVSELEARLCTLETKASPSYSQVVAGPAGRACSSRIASAVSPPASPVQPGEIKEGFVTVRGKRSGKRTTLVHQQLHVSNRFAPLSDTPAEPDTLVIGSSIVRDVKHPAVSVRCYPGARVGDIEGNLRLLKQSRKRFRRIVIHAGGNDARRRQSEVLKLNVASVCELAKSMADTVVFSGPLPNLVNDEMYSRFSSFNRWLSRWCPENDIIFVDNWHAFWGKPGLMRRDGIHPTWDGAALLTRNLAAKLSLPK